ILYIYIYLFFFLFLFLFFSFLFFSFLLSFFFFLIAPLHHHSLHSLLTPTTFFPPCYRSVSINHSNTQYIPILSYLFSHFPPLSILINIFCYFIYLFFST